MYETRCLLGINLCYSPTQVFYANSYTFAYMNVGQKTKWLISIHSLSWKKKKKLRFLEKMQIAMDTSVDVLPPPLEQNINQIWKKKVRLIVPG